MDGYHWLSSAALFLAFSISAVPAAALAQPREATPSEPRPGQRTAVIVVGLPGDEEHAAAFRDVVRAWRAWLTGPLGIAPQRVRVLGGEGIPESEPATRASLEAAWAALGKDLAEPDALWVFFLGHANYDGQRAFFHLRGPDVDSDSLAQWMRGVRCREQVIWLTQSCAGWFVKPLARPGRIIVAATAADFEFNDTEFPYALAKVAGSDPRPLDEDGDGQVSVLELFAAAVEETTARFQADQRVPTETAQLDDNGDGAGSPWSVLEALRARPAGEGAAARTTSPAAPRETSDGRLATATIVPYHFRPGEAKVPPAEAPESKP